MSKMLLNQLNGHFKQLCKYQAKIEAILNKLNGNAPIVEKTSKKKLKKVK